MKKILFALLAGVFAVMVTGCSKTEELAAVMEVCGVSSGCDGSEW